MSTSHTADSPPPAADPLSFRRVLVLATRSLPYLREVLRELLIVGGILMFMAAVGVPLGWFVNDVLTNRLGLGEPLTSFQAQVLRVDPDEFVHVEKLSVPARELLRDRMLVFGLTLTAIGTPWGIWIAIWWIRMQQRINQSLRNHMLKNVHAGSLRHHSDSRVGDSVYRTFQDSAQVTNLMSMFVLPVPMMFGLFTSVAAILAFEWWLPLVVLLGTAVIFALGNKITTRVRKNFRIMRERNSVLTSRVQESMTGVRVIKAYGAEDAQQALFERASREAFGAAFRARVGFANVNIAAFTIAALVALPLSAIMALRAAAGDKILAGALLGAIGYSQWSLAVYTSALGRSNGILNGARELLRMWMRAQDMAVGMDRAFDEVDFEIEVSDSPSAIPFTPPRDAIALDHVDFAYLPGRPVLRDVSLVARRGTVTGLVGPTGSGKSTLVSLLLRLFDPDAGAITVDGVNLREFQLESLRAQVGIALQENLLFGTTIRENIRYAVPDASDAQVREAARIACADEFIERLPAGYDTELGERGAKISSGQRQRLSIARAIIKNTPVLLLDEPTAALDADTELRVLENLIAWGEGRVILLITHRLSTIRRADQIVYLADGRVLEAGSHEDLMAREGGAYRRFVDLELESRSDAEAVPT